MKSFYMKINQIINLSPSLKKNHHLLNTQLKLKNLKQNTNGTNN